MANAFSEMPSRVKIYFHILKDDDHEKKKRKRKEKRKRTSVYTADKLQLPTRMLSPFYIAHITHYSALPIADSRHAQR
jgi:hypothetical protein